MPTKKEQTTAADVQDTTSEASPAKEEASETLSAKGWSEEILTSDKEEDTKLIIKDGEAVEMPTQDFVAAMNAEPTKEQNPTDRVSQEQQGIIGQDFFGTDDVWKATVLGQLPSGEHLQVMKRKENSMYYLGYREGLKKVDQSIQGSYTSFEKAEQAGRVYLNRVWDEQRATAASS